MQERVGFVGGLVLNRIGLGVLTNAAQRRMANTIPGKQHRAGM